MISQITEVIFIGEYHDITEETLKHYDFDVIINVNHFEIPEIHKLIPESVCYKWCPVPRDKDFKGDLKDAARVLRVLVNLKGFKRILIHCMDGIDRAPFVVALYLCKVAHLSLPQAYSLIKQQRKHIMEHYEWV